MCHLNFSRPSGPISGQPASEQNLPSAASPAHVVRSFLTPFASEDERGSMLLAHSRRALAGTHVSRPAYGYIKARCRGDTSLCIHRGRFWLHGGPGFPSPRRPGRQRLHTRALAPSDCFGRCDWWSSTNPAVRREHTRTVVDSLSLLAA